MDAVGGPALRDGGSPLLPLLWERRVLDPREVARALGPCVDLSSLRAHERERATREALAKGEALILGGRLAVHGLVGEPDLLRRQGGGYEAIDIRSAAALDEHDSAWQRAEWGVPLALCTDILERLGLAAGRHAFIIDSRGVETRYDLDHSPAPGSACLWESYLRARQAVAATLADPSSSQPALDLACRHCVWRPDCLARIEASDDLTLLPGLDRRARDALQDEFPDVVTLARADVEAFIEGDATSVPGVSARALRRFQRRAALACTPRAMPYLTRAMAWPRHGVEIFFTVKADALRDLSYLHGLLFRERDATGTWRERFEPVFAPTADASGERAAFATAMRLIRAQPDALVVHYSRLAHATCRRLAVRHPGIADHVEIERLFAPPRALDLYTDVVRSASEWPTRDFSLGQIAQSLGLRWREEDPSGVSSAEAFDGWARHGDPALRQRLVDFNEDECRALRGLWDAVRDLPVQPA